MNLRGCTSTLRRRGHRLLLQIPWRGTRFVWIFVAAGLLHVGWGIQYLGWPSPFAPPLALQKLQDDLTPALHLTGLPIHISFGIVLVLIGLLAMSAMFSRHHFWWFALAIAPQQAALVLSAIGSIQYIASPPQAVDLVRELTQAGVSPKNARLILQLLAGLIKRSESPNVIFQAQWPTIVICAAHLGAIVDHYLHFPVDPKHVSCETP